MGGYLDTIGAIFIGGLLILTMLNAFLTIQTMSLNASIYTNLNNNSENATDVISSRYLSVVGAGVSLNNSIDSATTNVFQFNGLLDGSIKGIKIKLNNEDTLKGWPLVVEVNGVLEMGPFYLQQDSIFTFYNEDDNQISFVGGSIPSASLTNIRLVKVEMTFFRKNYATNKPDIINKITFWKYLKNLFI